MSRYRMVHTIGNTTAGGVSRRLAQRLEGGCPPKKAPEHAEQQGDPFKKQKSPQIEGAAANGCYMLDSSSDFRSVLWYSVCAFAGVLVAGTTTRYGGQRQENTTIS